MTLPERSLTLTLLGSTSPRNSPIVLLILSVTYILVIETERIELLPSKPALKMQISAVNSRRYRSNIDVIDTHVELYQHLHFGHSYQNSKIVADTATRMQQQQWSMFVSAFWVCIFGSLVPGRVAFGCCDQAGCTLVIGTMLLFL